MGSPFPGMDPYLESPAHWADFHSTFIHALRESIADGLPTNYFARIQEDVLLLEPDTPSKRIGPDVYVVIDPLHAASPGAATGTAAVAELQHTTLRNVQILDPHSELYIEVVHLPDKKVVTVVEVLSPTNKSGDGRALYVEKRQRVLQRPFHLVEIDLLRAGKRVGLDRPLPPAHYYAFVRRSDRRPDCDVYHWTVRQRLPALPVPLRAPDPDVRVDLGAAHRVACQRGRYERLIDYAAVPPPPAFEDDAAAWVKNTARVAEAI